MCSEMACRIITKRHWPCVGCCDSTKRHMLTMRPTPNTQHQRTNTALWASSWHFWHKIYITEHKTPRHPPSAAHDQVTNTSHCAVHCYTPLSQLFKLPSYFETLGSAARLARMRSKSDPSNLHCCRHKKDESRRGKGSSLSFGCVLATLNAKYTVLYLTLAGADWTNTSRAVFWETVKKYSNSEET
jgi:hypothetical protein